jgi:threonine dehydrogenase-like Zn-dependent dehydrogenase
MNLHEKLPDEILSWRLKGHGLENFGSAGRPDIVPFPAFGEDDLIARVDACGLCFSDIKLITAGGTHPRIQGRDLAAQPVVPGHEVSLTIVGVGDAWKGRFAPGARYIIQADVFYKGKSMAFGYAIPGGLSQYVVLGREVIEGDEGCYLLPVREGMGRAEAALVEPWTCVIASSCIAARSGPKAGALVYFFGSAEGQVPLDLSGLSTVGISRIFHQGLDSENVRSVERLGLESGAPVAAGPPPAGGPPPTDVVCAGTPAREDFTVLMEALDAGGVIGIHSTSVRGLLPVDAGRVHYRGIGLVGSRDGGVLAPGGAAWFVGGAGPMGQMHVIKAVSDPSGPGRILVTDRSDERLSSLEHLVSLLAKDRGRKVSLSFVNSADLEGDELEGRLGREFPEGFDDIVILAPLAALVGEVSGFLAPKAVLNIFAGVKIGAVADIPLDAIVEKGVRITGSSGSPLSAMKRTLAMVESGELSTALSLAAVGDMYSAAKGMKALIDGVFTGKVVIFPFAHGMGLKTLSELARDLPEIAPLLIDGRYWTNNAEAAFFESKYFRPV